MKYSKSIFSIVSLSLFLLACGNNPHPKTEENTKEAHHNHDASETIALNNGKKWAVDSNMLTHIRNMENDILTVSKNQPKDYKSLSVKLQKNIDKLTSNCTMTGKAHDEFHKWLLPYIAMINELAAAKEDTEAEKTFAQIQISYATFNQHFE